MPSSSLPGSLALSRPQPFALRFLVLSLLLSLGWSLRGQFGHLHGAAIPGALFVCGIFLLKPRAAARENWGAAMLLGTVGFALGGHFGYGRSVETIIETASLRDAAGPLMRVLVIGAVWGGLGATLAAYGLQPVRFMREGILLSGLFLIWFVLLGPLNLESLDLALFGGGFLVLQGYNFWVKKSDAVATLGLAGILAFGGGFAAAVFLLRAGEQGHLIGPGRWWVLRDQILGLWAGCWMAAALGRLPEPGEGDSKSARSAGSFKFAVFLLAVAVPAVNTANVYAHWFLAREPVYAQGPLLFILAAGIVFGGGTFLIFRFPSSGDPLRFGWGALLLTLWYLSFLAIAKETVLYGWGRWETAYTCFILGSGGLTALSPWLLRRQGVL